MRIIILGTRGFPNVQGGVEKHCEHLSVNLVRLGCDVIVFTRKPYVEENIKEFKGVRLIALPAFRRKALEAFFHTLIGIFAALRYRPDILHIQAIGPALFTPLAKILGMKVVVTSHGSNYKHLKWGRFAKFVLRSGEFLGVSFANSTIAISETIADEIRKKYNRNVTVIPNGVKIEEITKNDRVIEKYGLTRGKYILSIGRFVPDKGFDILIDAFQELKLQDWKLVIAGQADHEDRYSLDLKERARKNSNIILTGFLAGEPLRELYSHAGLYILPSYYEGLSIVLLEAMSYGLSCILSDIQANKNVELSEDRFFKTGKVTELAVKIRKYVNKPLTANERAKQINMMAEKYDWERIAYRTSEVYRVVIGYGV